ncbi:hypothetical protein GALL_302400 [mine drainage metagenome]|uniref:Uncharacterized protein n=1 Tax=mine drainage metagenome TaxID=410659 RepID=A0A1J5R749_9ZZZZ
MYGCNRLMSHRLSLNALQAGGTHVCMERTCTPAAGKKMPSAKLGQGGMKMRGASACGRRCRARRAARGAVRRHAGGVRARQQRNDQDESGSDCGSHCAWAQDRQQDRHGVVSKLRESLALPLSSAGDELSYANRVPHKISGAKSATCRAWRAAAWRAPGGLPRFCRLRPTHIDPMRQAAVFVRSFCRLSATVTRRRPA